MEIGYDINTLKDDTDAIYITQEFVRTSCNKKIKEEIDFTSEMFDHLNNYSKLLLYNLNKLVDEQIEYVDHGKSYPIRMASLLNNFATYQLLLTVDDRLNEECIKRSLKNFTSSLTSFKIVPMTLILPNYISPAELVNSEGGLSENIKSRIKNGEIDKLGINVALFDNKTFLVSIVFAESNK